MYITIEPFSEPLDKRHLVRIDTALNTTGILPEVRVPQASLAKRGRMTSRDNFSIFLAKRHEIPCKWGKTNKFEKIHYLNTSFLSNEILNCIDIARIKAFLTLLLGPDRNWISIRYRNHQWNPVPDRYQPLSPVPGFFTGTGLFYRYRDQYQALPPVRNRYQAVTGTETGTRLCHRNCYWY